MSSKRKTPLPDGWVEKPSSRHPERVYYFNVNTGASTWILPKVQDQNRSSDLEEGEIIDSSDEEPSKKMAKTPSASRPRPNPTAVVSPFMKRRSDKEKPSPSPARHSNRKTPSPRKTSEKSRKDSGRSGRSSGNESGGTSSRKKGSNTSVEKSETRTSSSQGESTKLKASGSSDKSSIEDMPRRASARQLGLKPPTGQKPLRRPRSTSTGSDVPRLALAPPAKKVTKEQEKTSQAPAKVASSQVQENSRVRQAEKSSRQVQNKSKLDLKKSPEKRPASNSSSQSVTKTDQSKVKGQVPNVSKLSKFERDKSNKKNKVVGTGEGTPTFSKNRESRTSEKTLVVSQKDSRLSSSGFGKDIQKFERTRSSETITTASTISSKDADSRIAIAKDVRTKPTPQISDKVSERPKIKAVRHPSRSEQNALETSKDVPPVSKSSLPKPGQPATVSNVPRRYSDGGRRSETTRSVGTQERPKFQAFRLKSEKTEKPNVTVNNELTKDTESDGLQSKLLNLRTLIGKVNAKNKADEAAKSAAAKSQGSKLVKPLPPAALVSAKKGFESLKDVPAKTVHSLASKTEGKTKQVQQPRSVLPTFRGRQIAQSKSNEIPLSDKTFVTSRDVFTSRLEPSPELRRVDHVPSSPEAMDAQPFPFPEAGNVPSTWFDMMNQAPCLPQTPQQSVFPCPNAVTDPLPIRGSSPFEMVLNHASQSFIQTNTADCESMDVDLGPEMPLTGMTTPVSSRTIGRLSAMRSGGLSNIRNQSLYIILDTNTLIDHTEYIKDLRDKTFDTLGKPVIIVPWIVMQELDGLKDNKGIDKNQPEKIVTQTKARTAVQFLHLCFRSKHPRMVGQTPKEAAEPVEGNLQIETNDDQVLQCCLQCKEKAPEAEVVLFTNDKNLCNKALIIGIRAYTRKNLESSLQSENEEITDNSNGKRGGIQVSDVPPKKTGKDMLKKLADDILCELKDMLHEGFAVILRTELEAAYDDMWKQIVYRKPPWTLSDILESLNKHWIAVFGNAFGRDLHPALLNLVNHFKSEKGTEFGESVGQICSLLDSSIALFEVAKNFENNNLPKMFQRHLEHQRLLRKICKGVRDAKVAVGDLEQLKVIVQSNSYSDTVVTQPPATSSSQPTTPNVIHSSHQVQSILNYGANSRSSSPILLDPFQEQRDFEAVQHKFQVLWENINHFCEILLQVLEHPTGNSSGLPSREESLVFFAKLQPCIQELQENYLSVLLVPPETLHEQVHIFSNFCQTINRFFDKLEVQISSPPLEPPQLTRFYADNEKREVLKRGYNQLEDMINRLQYCDSLLMPLERAMMTQATLR